MTGHLLSGEALSFHQVAQITKRRWSMLRAHLYVVSEDFSAAEYWGAKTGATLLSDRRHYTPSQQKLLPIALLLDACMKKSRREIWDSASSGARELCSVLWVVLELCRDLWNPLTHPEIIPLDGQFWKWHTFGIAYNFSPNQEPGISRCSINVSDWLIKKIKLFQRNWF